ncbi:hypothetical protein ACWGLF_45575 [Streptomyces puniciscabiei]
MLLVMRLHTVKRITISKWYRLAAMPAAALAGCTLIAERRSYDVPPEIAAVIECHTRAAVVLDGFIAGWYSRASELRLNRAAGAA